MNESDGQIETPLHAAGEGGDLLASRLGQVNQFQQFIDAGGQGIAGQSVDPPDRGNTTLTLVATNQKLDHYILEQLSRHVHSSMARAIYPFHTTDDGDILFAASTNEVENPDLNHFVLSHLASELAWEAVLGSFRD